MRLLITGSKGQLGTELVGQAASHTIHAVDYDALDITNESAVERVVEVFKPDAVINAAAYTAVDKAESNREIAFAVNAGGSENLANACALRDIPLIHVSTDYVFDGSKDGAYVEDDPVAPLGVYGESKLAGEVAIRKACAKHLIFRTSWVFSAHGNNFTKTMLRLGAEREELGVVADQFGKPTAASELARVILDVLPNLEGHWGTYHLVQPDATNWHGFAKAIFDEAERQGIDLKLKHVNAIDTSAYPTPAKRPANSELCCDHLESIFDVKIQPWRTSLAKVIAEIVQNLPRL